MLANLEANGLDPRTLPMVVQMNKRDLPDSCGEGEFAELLGDIRPPLEAAVAIRGEGVVETLHTLLQRCYRSLDATFGLEANWQITEREFLGQIFSHVDLRGTRLPPEAQTR
jgi:hypothetical protein